MVNMVLFVVELYIKSPNKIYPKYKYYWKLLMKIVYFFKEWKGGGDVYSNVVSHFFFSLHYRISLFIVYLFILK